jgi:hypothetical protein
MLQFTGASFVQFGEITTPPEASKVPPHMVVSSIIGALDSAGALVITGVVIVPLGIAGASSTGSELTQAAGTTTQLVSSAKNDIWDRVIIKLRDRDERGSGGDQVLIDEVFDHFRLAADARRVLA